MVGREHLPKAMSISQTAGAVGMLAGPALGGLLVGVYGVRLPLLLDAATFLAIVAAGLALRTRRGGRARATAQTHTTAPTPTTPLPESSAATDIAWRLRDDRILLTFLTALGAVIAAVTAVSVVEIFFVRETLHASTVMYGFVGAAWTLGTLVGAWPFSRVRGDDRRLVTIFLFLLARLSLIVLVSAGVPGAIWLVPFYIVGGGLNAGFNVLAGVSMGRRVPSAIRGRVAGDVLRRGQHRQHDRVRDRGRTVAVLLAPVADGRRWAREPARRVRVPRAGGDWCPSHQGSGRVSGEGRLPCGDMSGQRRPRVGHIEFLNCLPLYWGLMRSGALLGVDLHRDTPDRLSLALIDGALDIGPISLVEYLRHADAGAPAARSGGGQRRAGLLGQPRLEGATARTSTGGGWPWAPTRVPVSCWPGCCWNPGTACGRTTRRARPISGRMLSDADAAVLIGDPALRARHEAPAQGLLVTDLGQEWRDWTGLPMVFAVWAVRRDFAAAHPGVVKEVHDAFLDSRRLCLDELDAVAEAAARWETFSAETLAAYFRTLDFSLAQRQVAGLCEFAARAAATGEVPPLAPDGPEFLSL